MIIACEINGCVSGGLDGACSNGSWHTVAVGSHGAGSEPSVTMALQQLLLLQVMCTVKKVLGFPTGGMPKMHALWLILHFQEFLWWIFFTFWGMCEQSVILELRGSLGAHQVRDSHGDCQPE